MIGSRRNDDWAVSRAADCTLVTIDEDGGESGGDTERAVSRTADCTLLVLEIDAEFAEGCQQSRRLHPDDNEDGDECG